MVLRKCTAFVSCRLWALKASKQTEMANILLSSISDLTLNLLSAITGPSSSSSLPSPSTSRRFSDCSSVPEELKKLKNSVYNIQTLLLDAEKKEIKDKSVKFWLTELKHIAYDIEDILEDIDFELLRLDIETSIPKVVDSSSSSLNSHVAEQKHDIDGELYVGAEEKMNVEVSDTKPSLSFDVSFQNELLQRIKDVTETFDEINETYISICLTDEDGQLRPAIEEPRSTSHMTDLSRVYGRKKEKKTIMQALFSGDAFSVVSIVAMGGMGKTTLAKLVYNDNRVIEHFETRAWSWVSENYDESKIIRDLIESITDGQCKIEELNLLNDKLKELLEGQVFLIVLDDIWNEDPLHWESLRRLLSVGAKGSRVIVTSRNKNAASVLGTGFYLNLAGLGKKSSWLLFCKYAFDGQDPTHIPSQLRKIGRKIVKKCKGVPLMIATLAGLLANETREEYWDDAFESDIFDLKEGEKQILQVLKLSYYHLPAPLKQCFTYCAVFPKGHEFHRETLVRMWIAQGYIQTQEMNQMEVIGERYVTDLLKRAFFHDPIYKSDNYCFSVHDLMHDLAKVTATADKESSIKDYETFEVTDRIHEIPTNRYIRHISARFYNPKTPYIFPFLPSLKASDEHASLRSLMLYHVSLDFAMNLSIAQKLQHLRVLEVTYRNELPETIGDLKQLRYLSLTGIDTKRLPESLCKLYKLETLHLDCMEPVELPTGITKLINLRHLVLFPETILIPPGIGKLTRLQTLSSFALNSRRRSAKLSELKDLNDLSGTLKIEELLKIKDDFKDEVITANLRSKSHLNRLSLNWNVDLFGAKIPQHKIVLAEEVLESLRPNINIQTLEIQSYVGLKFPTWLGDPSFSKLAYVRLFGCRKCELLPTFAQLPSLEQLYIEFMKNLQSFGTEEYNNENDKSTTASEMFARLKGDTFFPCLKRLVFFHCSSISSISIYNLTALQSLEVCRCRKLTSIHGFEAWLTVVKQDKETGPSGMSLAHPAVGCSNQESLPMNLKTVEINLCPKLPKTFRTKISLVKNKAPKYAYNWILLQE